ncbi:hypothetical protein [Geobacter sp.]|uniref:hypothetical protein n=1 Tax=Geobacter sp. TaxID=46610 RepID=UPI0026281859|nr:hypothetical protein [Geobacter sp.]
MRSLLQILLGLTATPERMDGDNVAADFGNRFAAEIRLPEALEEKLLCNELLAIFTTISKKCKELG